MAEAADLLAESGDLEAARELWVAALDSGKMRAYGTDVWESDPPPETSPLLKAKNVFMTPHLGASSKENLLRIGDVVISILEDRTSK